MSFMWKIPNNPIDRSVLDRMKQHFHKPTDLMPVAWFMGFEIKYYTWLAEIPADDLDFGLLINAMNEIAGGITAFPEVKFVSTWKDWFKYLLPYAIANADKGWGSNYDSVLLATLTAFVSIYPLQIYEEYKGFRDDVVYSLGARILPHISSIDQLHIGHVSNLLFTFPEEPQRISDDFSLPMLFGLKYLEPLEIEEWVKSIIGIKNYAWRFAVIDWWLTFNKFLQLAADWPESGELEPLLDIEDGLVETFWITRMKYQSLDAFIPYSHRIAFQDELTRELTLDVVQSWVTDIRAHKTFTSDSVEPLPEPVLNAIQQVLAIFEQRFFH